MKKLLNNSKLNNNGFTLVELTVVIAVTAIIASMVATFSILVSSNIKITKFDASIIEEVNDIKNNVNEFLELFDNGDYELTVTDDEIVAIKDSTSYSLHVDYNSLQSTSALPNGKTIGLDLQNVVSIGFEKYVVGGKNCVKVNVVCYKTVDKDVNETQQFEFIKYQYTENIVEESV